MIIKINNNIELSRYDLEETPDRWNAEFWSKKTQYSKLQDLETNNMGPKNLEGFYFLHDNIETTKKIAPYDCHKYKKGNYWITITTTKRPIKILDFSNCRCLHDMLDILDVLNINIYDSEMKINGLKNIKIKNLQCHNRNTRILHGHPELLEVAWFGQLLTDYQNGKIFKQLIVDSRIEIDGYRWCENHNPYSLTYCFFDCDMLNNPNISESYTYSINQLI